MEYVDAHGDQRPDAERSARLATPALVKSGMNDAPGHHCIPGYGHTVDALRLAMMRNVEAVRATVEEVIGLHHSDNRSPYDESEIARSVQDYVETLNDVRRLSVALQSIDCNHDAEESCPWY